jgi:hypothetical protein
VPDIIHDRLTVAQSVGRLFRLERRVVTRCLQQGVLRTLRRRSLEKFDANSPFREFFIFFIMVSIEVALKVRLSEIPFGAFRPIRARESPRYQDPFVLVVALVVQDQVLNLEAIYFTNDTWKTV